MSTTWIEWIDQQYLDVATAAASKAGADDEQAARIALEVLIERLEKQADDIRARALHAEGNAYRKGMEHAAELSSRVESLRRMLG